ncbi:MAG: prepilin-type N-terminal cleavage/methylation domain-containing protein [Caldisericum sp.]|uniref:prepilin-type N-terminal cleavage/methylation domain-containing protein n=1 Tax=Caldisericum sp. TaxID=2499687 RepID=UPI003D12F7C6
MTVQNTGNRPGYTLIEILIVIVIIMLIATLITPVVVGQLRKSKISSIEQSLHNIGVALEMYNKDWGFYPPGDGYIGWLSLKDELTGSKNAIYNNPDRVTAKTLTGENGGIQYIDIQSLNSLEHMIQDPETSINYDPVAFSNKDDYFLIIEEDCFGKKVKFTLKPGAAITIEFLP